MVRVARLALPCLLIFTLIPQGSAALPAGTIPVQVATYSQLVHAIREAQAQARTRVEQAVEHEKVREAWEIGKLIDEHILYHKERADYGEQVVKRLAGDLGTSKRELHYMVEFARAYPIVPQGAQLSWSHYRALLSLNDSKEREEVTKEAVRQGWSRDQVREEIHKRNSRAGRVSQTEKLPVSKPGKLFTYRVVKAVVGPLIGQLVVDLGFSNYFQPDKISKFKEGELVTLEQGKLKRFSGGEDGLFAYTAYVTQVIDADTFRAVVDLGFKFSTVQTLRLRGLDAPEIESAEGKEAKAFVEKLLRSASGGEAISAPVLIRTVKSDKYDRYLADVWVGETYLNQKLIDKGLAVKVNE